MVVKSSRDCLVSIAYLGILVLATELILLSEGGAVPSVILLVVSTLLLGSYGIAVGRSIAYDEKGCTIRVGKWERFYGWEELTVKRLEPAHLGLRSPYRYGGVFFAVCKVHKPKLCDPCLYAMLFCPVACFWVYFVPDSAQGTPGIYEVNRETFLGCLKAWGIPLDES